VIDINDVILTVGKTKAFKEYREALDEMFLDSNKVLINGQDFIINPKLFCKKSA